MRKLAPGALGRLFAAGQRDLPPRAYWSPAQRAAAAAASPFAGSAADAADRLQFLIDEAVAMRMEADVRWARSCRAASTARPSFAAMEKDRAARAVRSFCVRLPRWRAR